MPIENPPTPDDVDISSLFASPPASPTNKQQPEPTDGSPSDLSSDMPEFQAAMASTDSASAADHNAEKACTEGEVPAASASPANTIPGVAAPGAVLCDVPDVASASGEGPALEPKPLPAAPIVDTGAQSDNSLPGDRGSVPDPKPLVASIVAACAQPPASVPAGRDSALEPQPFAPVVKFDAQPAASMPGKDSALEVAPAAHLPDTLESQPVNFDAQPLDSLPDDCKDSTLEPAPDAQAPDPLPVNFHAEPPGSLAGDGQDSALGMALDAKPPDSPDVGLESEPLAAAPVVGAQLEAASGSGSRGDPSADTEPAQQPSGSRNPPSVGTAAAKTKVSGSRGPRIYSSPAILASISPPGITIRLNRLFAAWLVVLLFIFCNPFLTPNEQLKHLC